jgi:hypothetical protein
MKSFELRENINYQLLPRHLIEQLIESEQ